MGSSVQATAAVAGPGSFEAGGQRSRKILVPALVLFMLSCVFDPADRLLGLKVELFLVCWFVTVVLCAARRERWAIHPGLLIHTLLFISVPVVSIVWYWFVDGGKPFEGFQLLKGYILITLGALLFINRINVLPHLSAVLTLLSIAIIGVFVALTLQPELLALLHMFGESTGIVLVDNRDYGAGLVLLQVYFVTSSMLAISIAHYFHRARTAQARRRKLWYGALMLVNVCAMLLAGTRNNIAVALLLPLVLFFLYSKHKVINAIVCGAFLTFLAVMFFDEIRLMLDPTEVSNNIKLLLLKDYGEFFSDPVGLLFGQGLGAYHYWEAKGTYFYVSELTYLELIRNFGAFGAMLMLGLLLFPLLYAFVLYRSFDEKHIIIGYAFYLVMCISNPNLFSSMGILILSVVLANIFLYDRGVTRHAARPRS